MIGRLSIVGRITPSILPTMDCDNLLNISSVGNFRALSTGKAENYINLIVLLLLSMPLV